MKRLVLFSSPKGNRFEEILEKIFPQEIENKVLAYMPTYQKYLNSEYTDFWKGIAKKYNTEFVYLGIDENITDEERVRRLKSSNILIMTGGNTFWLLDYLRRTGMYQAIEEMAKKDEFVISGWSAGAMILTPSITAAGSPRRIGGKTPFDENKVGITDLSGFGFVDYEIFPHYEESLKEVIDEYQKKTPNEVKRLTDNDYIVIDL